MRFNQSQKTVRSFAKQYSFCKTNSDYALHKANVPRSKWKMFRLFQHFKVLSVQAAPSDVVVTS